MTDASKLFDDLDGCSVFISEDMIALGCGELLSYDPDRGPMADVVRRIFTVMFSEMRSERKLVGYVDVTRFVSTGLQKSVSLWSDRTWDYATWESIHGRE